MQDAKPPRTGDPASVHKQVQSSGGRVFGSVSLPNGKKLSTMREDVFRAVIDASRKK